jgi:hypothetical protein
MRMRADRLLVAALLGGVFAAPSLATEPIKGESKELGISIEVAGGKSDWCAPQVTVSLKAKAAPAFVLETLKFTQMIGRVRATVLDACPFVERLAFEATAPNGYASLFEMTRLTGWRRYVVLDSVTKQAKCPSTQMSAVDCARSVMAYEAAHEMLSGDEHREAILTTFLDDSGATHVVWREGESVGKLTFVDREETLQAFGSIAAFADTLITETARSCVRGDAASADVSFKDDATTAERSVGCPVMGARAKASIGVVCPDLALCHVTASMSRSE